MINTATYGKDGTAMMGFTIHLTRSQIASVVDYVRSTFMFPEELAKSSNSGNSYANIPNNGISGHRRTRQSLQGSADMSAPLPFSLKGEKDKGKVFFDGNCATCHGKEGLGNGPRAYFIFPRPANFNTKRARSEFNRPHLFKIISEGLIGTVMPSWSKVLSNQEIANVAEHVFTAFIKPQIQKPTASINVQSSPASPNRGNQNWQRYLGGGGNPTQAVSPEPSDPNANLRLKKKP